MRCFATGECCITLGTAYFPHDILLDLVNVAKILSRDTMQGEPITLAVVKNKTDLSGSWSLHNVDIMLGEQIG